MSAPDASARAVPFHCPYCGEEDLRPLAAGDVLSSGPALARDGWHCRSCLRVFAVSYFGLHHPTSTFSARESDHG